MWMLVIFLSIAVIQDMRSLKVSNRLIFVGICAAIPFRIFAHGIGDIVWILPNTILPVFVLYLLYLAGVLGAADIKLFSLVGSYLSLKELSYSVVAAFVIGAFFSVLKMIEQKNFWCRMTYGFSYMCDVARGNFKAYEMRDDRSVIHFSVAILLGVIIVKLFIK